MKGYFLALVSLLAVCLPARGELIYKFSYTPTSGTVQGFSFSIVSPNFIGQGPLTFEPFSIIDRSTVLPVTQGFAGVAGGGSTSLPDGTGCFAFGTSGADALAFYQGCGWAIPNASAPQAAFSINMAGGLPMRTLSISWLPFNGLVVLDPLQHGDFFGNCCAGALTGNLQLSITGTPAPSSVPEPSGIELSAAGISVLGILLLKSIRDRKMRLRTNRSPH